MSDPDLSPSHPPSSPPPETARLGLRLVRLPVERPAPAVEFLHQRSAGVMDLLAHFWERLPQTPPLARADLHLVMALKSDNDNENINISQIDCNKCSGAMLFVPKAHRADVLALDHPTAAVFAAYISQQGPKAIKSDNIEPPAPPASTPPDSDPPISVALTDFSAPRSAASALEMPSDPARTSNAANGKVPIDFLTGNADGIAWMTPLLLPAVHRRAPARQVVNVMMQLLPEIPCQPDASVRVAREADVPTLNRWRRLYKEERGILFDADLDAWVQTQKVFVYEHDKQIVSVAKFDLELPRLIEIGGVYTFAEFRNRGFGAKIVSDLACRIRQSNKLPTLQVDVQNTPALRLYENAGWQPMGKLARVWLTG